MTPPPHRRTLAKLAAMTWICVGAFVALEAVAMHLYPGGTWFDRATVGYSLRFNFFCDLTANAALDGAPNPAAPFARGAMLALSIGMLPFWWCLAELAPNERARAVVRATGISSSVVSSAVPFLSSLDVGSLHGAVTLTAGSFGLVAAGLGVFGAYRRGVMTVAISGTFAFGMGAWVSALYVPAWLRHADARDLPGAQKVAAAAVLTWMSVTVLETRRRSLLDERARDGVSVTER